jgi:hypothetical protein
MAKLLLAGLFSVISTAHAEPAQYCNFQAGKDIPPATNDFCVAVSTYRNHTSNAQDVHITLDVYRSQNNARGWSAVGIGEGMAQALTFMVYGDPKNPSGPVVSVRRANGCEEPQPYHAKANKAGIHVQVLSSAWTASSYAPHNKIMAHISLVCYACDTGLDPGLGPLVSTTSGQPQAWIWAKNTQQPLSGTPSQHATLEFHSMVGRGYFFVDMARSVTTTPGPPSIRPGVTAAGASETKDGLSLLGQGSRARTGFAHVVKTALHGFSMALAFQLLLPAGVLAMVSRHAGAFQRHWMVQAAAMACISVGLVLGLLLRPRLSTTHQLLGVATISAVGVQAALGAAHHMKFVRAPRRTWMARVHVPLGRLVLLAGHASVLTGLVLHRAPVFQFVVTGAIAAAEVLWMAVMAGEGGGEECRC